jgi:cysteine-S-conjugate beta-lyase
VRKDTLLGQVARPKPGRVPVNPSVQRASTILFETVAEFEAAQKARAERDVLFYGTYGTETTFAFATALAALENAYGAIAVSSGLAAIVATIQAFVGSGQHLLVPDSVYHPGRIACDGVLKDLGVETTYYNPLIGSGIAELIQPNTRLIYMESPGSMTFEVQDVPAIVAVAKSRDIPTAIDNTWATGYYFNAIAHGVDVSIHAATIAQLGYSASPDDCWLGLRGLRTLGVRLGAHAQRALIVAEFLRNRQEIDQVLYPALPGALGHELWKRDFQGATGLFSFLFKREISERSAIAMVEKLKLFGLGASWGGYESLVLLSRPARTSPRWKDAGAIIRLHVGLEDPVDLVEDLREAFTAL